MFINLEYLKSNGFNVRVNDEGVFIDPEHYMDTEWVHNIAKELDLHGVYRDIFIDTVLTRAHDLQVMSVIKDGQEADRKEPKRGKK